MAIDNSKSSSSIDNRFHLAWSRVHISQYFYTTLTNSCHHNLHYSHSTPAQPQLRKSCHLLDAHPPRQSSPTLFRTSAAFVRRLLNGVQSAVRLCLGSKRQRKRCMRRMSNLSMAGIIESHRHMTACDRRKIIRRRYRLSRVAITR